MYEVGSSKANTGLYNVGKGGAQVFDTSIVERAIVRKEDKVAAKKVAKAKTDAANRKRATDLVAKGIGKVRPADVDHFKGRTAAYRKKVKDAYGNGRTLSLDEEIELNQEWSVIAADAKASENLYAMDNAEVAKVYGANSMYGSRAKNRVNERILKSSVGEDGTFNPNPPGSEVPRYASEKFVKESAATRFKAVETNKRLGRTGWTEDQATEDAIALLKNPKFLRETQERLEDMYDEGRFDEFLNDMYTSKTDAYGNVNPVYSPDGVPDGITFDNVNLDDVVAYQYKNEFMVDGQDPLPKNYTDGGGSDDYDPKGTITTIDPATGEMNTTTGGINEKPLLSRRNYRGKVVEGAPPSNIKFDPKTGVLLSAEMVTGPTADQIKTNAIARKLNTDNEKDFQEYLEAWGLNKDIPVPNKDLGWMKFGRTFSTDPDEKQYKKDVAARDEKIAKARAKFPITEVVDQENIVPLTPKEAIDLYSQTWGINIYDAYGSQKNPQGGAAVILDKHAEALKKAGEVEAAVAEDIDYSNVEEAGIARVMKAKRWTREHAIKVLRAADKIR